MSKWLAIWRCGDGFADVREAWLARTVGLGEELSVHVGKQKKKGIFAGIDENGLLLLDDGSGRVECIRGGILNMGRDPR